jgi:folate-dependent tRNA-U54 methylase TrmFO/GidA
LDLYIVLVDSVERINNLNTMLITWGHVDSDELEPTLSVEMGKDVCDFFDMTVWQVTPSIQKHVPSTIYL